MEEWTILESLHFSLNLQPRIGPTGQFRKEMTEESPKKKTKKNEEEGEGEEEDDDRNSKREKKDKQRMS